MLLMVLLPLFLHLTSQYVVLLSASPISEDILTSSTLTRRRAYHGKGALLAHTLFLQIRMFVHHALKALRLVTTLKPL